MATPQLGQSVVVLSLSPLFSPGFGRAPVVRSSVNSISQTVRRTLRRRMARLGVAVASLIMGFAVDAAAQSVETRQWQGITAVARQPEQVVAGTLAEWRSLWSRVGVAAPDLFEPGRTKAVGIFLGVRTGSGYSVNVLSASRRRDRIMVMFEERAPSDIMSAQRVAPRAVTGSSGAAPGAAFASPNTSANLAPMPGLPASPPTSPWAIVLINRADLPVSVEQRLFH